MAVNRLSPEKVPKEEIGLRIRGFQALLQEKEIDCAIVRHNPDLYYLTGTVQDGHLFVPQKGEPTFYVWRSFERAIKESAIKDIKKIKNFAHLKELSEKDGHLSGKRIGITMDTLPCGMFLFYSGSLLKHANFVDCTPLLRTLKAVKSPWEIKQIERACHIIDLAMEEVPRILCPGIRELELAARVEAILRAHGHQGFIRMRAANQELGMSQILSGPHGAVPSWTLTPAGGPGVSPAFGVGSGYRKIREGEPVSVDLGGYYNGYFGDETRLFSIGGLTGKLKEALGATLELRDVLEDNLKPGIEAGLLYEIAVDFMESRGFGENFMGYEEKVQFIGHGLGVEIDEYPFISKGNTMKLEPNMVVALEPKLVFSGLGIVGIEDTFLITNSGSRRFTKAPRFTTV